MIFQMKKSNVISDVLYKTVVFSNYFQSVMKVNRKKRNPKIQKRQQGFVGHWPINDQQKKYDAFEDQHTKMFFILPSVQGHMKKLKRAIRKDFSSQAEKLTRSIDSRLKSTDIKQYRKLLRNENARNKLLAESFIQLRSGNQTEHLRNGSRKLEASTTNQTVLKNRTEAKLPTLSKLISQIGNHSTERAEQVVSRASNPPKTQKKSSAIIEHSQFQRFLEQKKQQILRKSVAMEGGSSQI